MKKYKIELREIEISSPIESLKIGDDFFYSGKYIHGYEEGISKIKRFFKEVIIEDEVELMASEVNEDTVWMELENGKLILLGYFGYKDNFELSDTFKNNKQL